jgi:hypothetical protein
MQQLSTVQGRNGILLGVGGVIGHDHALCKDPLPPVFSTDHTSHGNIFIARVAWRLIVECSPCEMRRSRPSGLCCWQPHQRHPPSRARRDNFAGVQAIQVSHTSASRRRILPPPFCSLPIACPHAIHGAKMVYIRQDKLPKLKEYKYQGVDHSLVSQYVLKPFYSHVVIKCFPMWMA